MHLGFENWILSQKISETALGLFEEAVACYKASAYRASLLLSYLGFQTVVRNRILISKCPSGINPAQWNNIIQDLGDDDKWDTQIYDAIQMKYPKCVFKLSDDVRNQVTYWKNRRNDCAHSKRNEIDYSHVESFWLFVSSNLAKFVVNGSKEGLLNDIRTHFDRSLTAIGTENSHILEQIPNAIEPDELTEFFRGMYSILQELAADPFRLLLPDALDFISKIFTLNDNTVVARLIEFLKTEDLLLIEILRHYPERLLYFVEDKSFVRKLWFDKLFRPIGKNDFPLYCSLLRNNLIPKEQRDEAHRRIISLLNGAIPSDECFHTLKSSGFFVVFRHEVFVTSMRLASTFLWGNSNCEIIVLYLERFGIDSDVASGLGVIFSKKNHPWELAKSINSFLSRNPSRRKEFFDIFVENQIEIPEHLSIRDKETQASGPQQQETEDLPF